LLSNLRSRLNPSESPISKIVSIVEGESKLLWQGPFVGGTLQVYLTPDPSLAVFRLDTIDHTYQGACQLDLTRLGVASGADCVDRLLANIKEFYAQAVMQEVADANPTLQ